MRHGIFGPRAHRELLVVERGIEMHAAIFDPHDDPGHVVLHGIPGVGRSCEGDNSKQRHDGKQTGQQEPIRG